jgi:hypothetical protein
MESLRTLTCCVGCLVLLAGCQTDRDSVRQKEASLLAYVPESEQEEIQRLQRERAELDERLAAVRADVDRVQSLYELAEQNADALHARVVEARQRVQHARQFGDNDELRGAQERRDQLEDAEKLQRSKVAYYEDLVELAQRRLDLAQKRAALADVEVQVATAEVVQNLDRPAAKTVDADAQRDRRQQLAQEVDDARIEALVAHRRAELRSELITGEASDVPDNLRFEPIAELDGVFPTDVFAGMDDLGMSEATRDEAARSQRTDREGVDDRQVPAQPDQR